MKESKNGNLFLNEYQPELPYLKIEGKKYTIKEAWVEHPHLERNWSNIPVKGYDFVMTFDHNPHDSLNFKMYTRDLSLGNWKIWFFLPDEEYNKDTLVLYYRENLNTDTQRTFLLFKKK